MNAIKITNFRAVSWAVFLIFLVFVAGCTSQEEKRALSNNEMTCLYNDYLDEVSTLSEAEVLAKCDQAIQEFPDLAIAYELKGLILRKEGQLKPAWENYKKAIELAPSDADTLANAREVALLLNGSFVKVDENGKVITVPYKKIPLAEYDEFPEEIRLKMCLISLGIGEAVKQKVLAENKTETYVFVDRDGNEIEDMDRMTFGLTFEESGSASDLDSWLIQQANEKPTSTLGDVLWIYTAQGLSYGQIQ